MTNRSSKLKKLVIISVLFIVIYGSIQPVSASSHDGDVSSDFICAENPDDPGNPNDFAQALRNIITIMMVMGPVMGIFIHLFATVAMTVQTKSSTKNNYSEVRRNSLIYGFSVPIVGLGLKLVSNLIFGFSIDCLFPGYSG